MQSEDTKHFNRIFHINWFFANAIGIAFGWVFGEWLGLQAAKTFGWNFGKIFGFAIFEGSVWVFRWAVLSRIRAYDVLKSVDTFFWVATELIIGFGMQLGGGEPSYREASLFGIVSLPILSSWIGVIGWLIIWLIRTQMRQPQIQQPKGRSFFSSLKRAIGSVFIFFFLIAVMVISVEAGNAVGKTINWMLARVVAGSILGGLLSFLTGRAILSLLKKPVWDETM